MGGLVKRPRVYRTGLNVRALRFVALYLGLAGDGSSAGVLSRSARLAGYQGSDQALSTQGRRILRRLPLPLSDYLQAQGVDLVKIAEVVRAGLDAEETKAFLGKGGQVVYSRPLVSWSERRKYAELALALQGHATRKGHVKHTVEEVSRGRSTRGAVVVDAEYSTE